MSRPRISPRAYEMVTGGALAGLAFIVVTGAAVRLTGSGLGCPDWPTCVEGRVVAPLEYHALVEFVNRVVTGLVSFAVMAAVMGAVFRDPPRTDLTWLSFGLVAGVIGQIMLGAATVLFHLAPVIVMGHFLVSMGLLWNAVVLFERARQPSGPRVPRVSPEVAVLSRLTVATAALVIVTGTVVTASGPHGGDDDVERLRFLVSDVARLHGAAMVIFLAVALTTVVLSRRQVPQHRGTFLLAVLVVQAAVGYIQYFTGVPVVLVGVHVAGAVAVWITTLRFHMSLFAAVPVPRPRPSSSTGAVLAR